MWITLCDPTPREPKLIFQWYIMRKVNTHIGYFLKTHVTDFTGTCIVDGDFGNISAKTSCEYGGWLCGVELVLPGYHFVPYTDYHEFYDGIY